MHQRFRSLGGLHSPKLTWKPKLLPFRRTVVFIGHLLGFHVSFRECRFWSLGAAVVIFFVVSSSAYHRVQVVSKNLVLVFGGTTVFGQVCHCGVLGPLVFRVTDPTPCFTYRVVSRDCGNLVPHNLHIYMYICSSIFLALNPINPKP